MFFKERIIGIADNDRVLEVGPGGSPHSRSNVFLERHFKPDEAYRQSGWKQPIENDRIVFYDGKLFPFKDKEFDYVICSHVLEHVDDVELFISEVTRVGKRGYFEFPTVYYDFIFDIPEHCNVLLYTGKEIQWAKKSTILPFQAQPIQKAFYLSLFRGYGDIALTLYKELFFQGFEWDAELKTNQAEGLSALVFGEEELAALLKPKKLKDKERPQVGIARRVIRRILKGF